MAGYVLHLPEDESVVLSGAVASRLIQCGHGDAALLYIALLRNKGCVDDVKLRGMLRWSEERFQGALQALSAQQLVGLPEGAAARTAPEPERKEQRPEYTREDMTKALEGREFAMLTREVENRLGKKLTTPDLSLLLGMYDYLGLPPDVIFLLVGFCVDRSEMQYGAGRRPTMRQIEREGYVWARRGLMTQELASAYIRKYHQGRSRLPALMRVLRLGDREPSPTEEKYLLSWGELGFENEVIELAYDKTILKCKELKWAYMNKILLSWHEQGLHTMAEIRRREQQPAATPMRETRRRGDKPEAAAREDMARMEKYLQQLRQQSSGKGET